MTRLRWGVWVLLIAITFGVMEGIALYTGTPTLSRAVWDASVAFPLLPFIAGMLCGGLGVHFWWPNQGLKQ